MQKLFIILCLLLALSDVVRSSDFINITEIDIGNAHNEAFHELSQMYQDIADGTMEEKDVVESVISVLQDRCEEKDKLCKARAYKTTMQEFYGKKSRPRNFSDTDIAFPEMEVYLPEDFDPQMRDMIITVRETLSLLKERSAEEVIQELYGIMGDIFLANPENILHQIVALAATSMAIGSTRLWSRITVEESSDLHKMSRGVNMCTTNYQNRRLEEEEFSAGISTRLTRAVQADMDGAVRGAKEALGSYLTAFNFMELINDPRQIVSLMLETAIASSAAAFMNSGL